MKTQDKSFIQLENLDKLQRLDHDMLIRLETKLDGVAIDIKEVKEVTTIRLSNLENRVNELEKLRDELNPREVVKKVNEVYQRQYDFQLTWKVVVAVAAGIGGIVGFLISTLVNVSQIFK